MKTLSIVSTQMQLINCVEYLTKFGYSDNELIVYSRSRDRKKQINYLLHHESYNNIFNIVSFINEKENRIIGLICSIWHILVLLLKSYKKCDACISGNYLMGHHRFLISKISRHNPSCKIVFVDDGLSTIDVPMKRKVEKEKGVPIMFKGNAILRNIIKISNKQYIPEQITMYTVYNISSFGNDVIIAEDYSYLKKVISSFQIDDRILSAGHFFLGQPLCSHHYISQENYIKYLERYSTLCDSDVIVYCPHPEELDDSWMLLRMKKIYRYTYIPFSFEILAMVLPPGTKVCSFFSSAIANIKYARNDIVLNAIFLNERDVIMKGNERGWKEIYNCYPFFESIGINVLHFSDI